MLLGRLFQALEVEGDFLMMRKLVELFFKNPALTNQTQIL